jgi:hypothetical protein
MGRNSTWLITQPWLATTVDLLKARANQLMTFIPKPLPETKEVEQRRSFMAFKDLLNLGS